VENLLKTCQHKNGEEKYFHSDTLVPFSK